MVSPMALAGRRGFGGEQVFGLFAGNSIATFRNARASSFRKDPHRPGKTRPGGFLLRHSPWVSHVFVAKLSDFSSAPLLQKAAFFERHGHSAGKSVAKRKSFCLFPTSIAPQSPCRRRARIRPRWNAAPLVHPLPSAGAPRINLFSMQIYGCILATVMPMLKNDAGTKHLDQRPPRQESTPSTINQVSPKP